MSNNPVIEQLINCYRENAHLAKNEVGILEIKLKQKMVMLEEQVGNLDLGAHEALKNEIAVLKKELQLCKKNLEDKENLYRSIDPDLFNSDNGRCA